MGPAGLVVILLAVFVVFIAWRFLDRPKTLDYPACGGCRYDVTGLTTSTCPECGADLDVVGVIPAGRRPPTAWWKLVLAATPLYVFVALFGYALLDQTIARIHTVDWTVTFSMPRAQATLGSVTFEGSERRWRIENRDVHRGTGVAHTVAATPLEPTVEIDLLQDEIRWSDSEWRPLDDRSLAEWLQDVDAGLDAAAALAQARQIDAELDRWWAEFTMYPVARFGTRSIGNSQAPFRDATFMESASSKVWRFFPSLYWSMTGLIWSVGAWLIWKGRQTAARR